MVGVKSLPDTIRQALKDDVSWCDDFGDATIAEMSFRISRLAAKAAEDWYRTERRPVRRFVRCPRCGKERQVSTPRGDWPDEGADKYFKTAAWSVCRVCDSEALAERDACPETVWVDDEYGWGSAACGLGWRHAGRCEPAVTNRDVYGAVFPGREPPGV